MHKVTLVLFAVAGLIGSPVAGQNLLVNGGFEQPSIKSLPGPWQNGWNTNWICLGTNYSLDYPGLTFPGWQISGEIDVMKDKTVLMSPAVAVRSAEGEQFADIDGRMPGTITQTVPVSPGARYRFRFSYAPYSAASMSATVLSSSGNTLFSTNISAAPSGTNAPAWDVVGADITATDNNLMVRFASTSRQVWMSGLLLDDVQLFQIAEATVRFGAPTNTPIRLGMGPSDVTNVTAPVLPSGWRFDAASGQIFGRMTGTNPLSVLLAGQRGSNPPVPVSVPVELLPQMAQTIAFSVRPIARVGDVIPLLTSSRSGLPVTVTSSDPNILRVEGSNAAALGKGRVTLTATQDGNLQFAPATPISRKVFIR